MGISEFSGGGSTKSCSAPVVVRLVMWGIGSEIKKGKKQREQQVRLLPKGDDRVEMARDSSWQWWRGDAGSLVVAFGNGCIQSRPCVHGATREYVV